MNLDKLKNIVPQNVLDQLPSVISKYSIDNIFKLSHFISQCQHESNNFTATSENLNYSKEGLLKTFSKYFTADLATACARKPEHIANIVYANRMGNGSVASGDGYRYRGRGAIMLTGKYSYEKYGKSIGVDLITSPGLVSSEYFLDVAGWYFTEKKIWNVCIDDSRKSIINVTKLINGGTIGLEDRILKFNKIYNALK